MYKMHCDHCEPLYIVVPRTGTGAGSKCKFRTTSLMLLTLTTDVRIAESLLKKILQSKCKSAVGFLFNTLFCLSCLCVCKEETLF